jgi:chaperone required for assembly of F1-ATPase
MIKKGYPDARHYLQRDEDAYLDAAHLCYDDNWDLKLLKRQNLYFDLVVQKYKNKKYYDFELDDEDNCPINFVLEIFRKIEEKEKQCKNQLEIDKMRACLAFRYI